MTISALKARPLPNYTKAEEALNSASHLIGAAIGVAVLMSCLAHSQDSISMIGSIVYGISMILLYLVSGIYHGMSPKRLLAKQLFRTLDHCTIYVLIAGTYTPVLLNVVYKSSPTLALASLGIIWAAAIFGIIFTAADLQKYSRLSMVCYIVMGWFALLLMKPIIAGIGIKGVVLLVAGGISYTVGAVIYGIGKKVTKRYVHFIFHLFVIVGTLFHYYCIFNYVIK